MPVGTHLYLSVFIERVIGGVRSKLNPPSIDFPKLLIDRVLFDLNPRLPQVG